MKWETWKNCIISEDKRVLKSDNIDQFPAEFKRLFAKGFNNPEYQAKLIQKAVYPDPYAINGNYNPKNEYVGLTFECNGEIVTVREKNIKKFIQKSSKFYVSSHLCPLIIENKNYVLMVALCCDDLKPIEYLPLI